MGLGVVWDALSLQMEYIGMDERLSVGELPDSTTTNTAEADPDAAAAEEEEAAFLDDIGANLKPARAMGMTTLRVVEPEATLRELEAVLGRKVHLFLNVKVDPKWMARRSHYTDVGLDFDA